MAVTLGGLLLEPKLRRSVPASNDVYFRWVLNVGETGVWARTIVRVLESCAVCESCGLSRVSKSGWKRPEFQVDKEIDPEFGRRLVRRAAFPAHAQAQRSDNSVGVVIPLRSVRLFHSPSSKSHSRESQRRLALFRTRHRPNRPLDTDRRGETQTALARHTHSTPLRKSPR